MPLFLAVFWIRIQWIRNQIRICLIGKIYFYKKRVRFDQKRYIFRGPFVHYEPTESRSNPHQCMLCYPVHTVFWFTNKYFVKQSGIKFVNLIDYFFCFQTYFNQNALTLIRSLITGGATPELGNFFKGSTSRECKKNKENFFPFISSANKTVIFFYPKNTKFFFSFIPLIILFNTAVSSTAPQIPLCRRMLWSNPGQQRPRNWLSNALTTRLDLIYSKTRIDFINN